MSNYKYAWDNLERLYVEDKLSIREIAKLKGCSFTAVRHAMMQLNIQRRDHLVSILFTFKAKHHTGEAKRLMSSLWTEKRRKQQSIIAYNMFSGTHHTEEWRQAMRQQNSGSNSPAFGKHWTKERRLKISGANSPHWKGGIARLPYPYGFRRELKKAIIERDCHACQLCGASEYECLTGFTIHHIDYSKENIKWANLTSLCRSCNTKVNFNRDYWQDFFTTKIKERYGLSSPCSN